METKTKAKTKTKVVDGEQELKKCSRWVNKDCTLLPELIFGSPKWADLNEIQLEEKKEESLG